MLSNFEDFAHLFEGNIHVICNFSKSGLSPIFLNKASTGVEKPVEGLVDMDWETNRSRLICYGPCDPLTNPPSGIGGEL